MLECRGFDIAVHVGLGIRFVSARRPRMPSALFKRIFGSSSGSAGVLVMEVEGSQSERRRRLATLRKRKRRDTCTAEER